MGSATLSVFPTSSLLLTYSPLASSLLSLEVSLRLRSCESRCPFEDGRITGFEVVVEEDVDEKGGKVDGILDSLVAVFLSVIKGLTESGPIPFLSESRVEEFL